MVERIRTLLESRQLTPTQFADVIGVARPIVSHILSGRNKPSLEVVQRILAAMPDLAMPWLLNGTGPMLAVASATAESSALSGEGTVLVASASAPAPASVTVDERRPSAVEATIKMPQALAPRIEHAESERISIAIPAAEPPRASTSAAARNRVVPKRFVANTASVEALLRAPTIASAPVLSLAVLAERFPVEAPARDAVPDPPVPLPLPPVEVLAAAALVSPVAATNESAGAALASALFAGGDKPIRRIVIFYRDGSFADYQPE